ncbi:MAG: DUF5615 family PIN-like protein [Chloroflexota bacterium]
MKIRYLLDENLPPRIKLGVQRIEQQIDVLRVGDPDVPPLQTKDPEILHYLELSQRILVTRDRASMPGHLQDFWAEGDQLWGILLVRPHTSTGRLIQELHFIWEASEAEEWRDKVDWIPL